MCHEIPAKIIPEYFYSTLSQSSAAIVGLMGGILGSRLIEHLSSARSERERLGRMLTESEGKINSRVAFLESCIKRLNERLNKNNELLRTVPNQKVKYEKFTWWEGFSNNPHNEASITEDVKDCETSLNQLKAVLNAYKTLKAEKSVDNVIKRINVLTEVKSTISENAHKKIDEDINFLSGAFNQISQFQSKLIHGHFIIVFILLVLIVLFGVISPLLFLPVLPKDMIARLIMIVVFAIGLIGIIAYFGSQMIELKQLGIFTWNQKK